MDLQLTPERTAQLTRLEEQVARIGGLIERARRANLSADSIAQLQAQLDQVENMRRGLLAEFGAGGPATRRAT